MRVDAVEHLVGHAVAAVDDRLHERLRARGRDLLDEGLGLDVDQLRQPARRTSGHGRGQTGLVDAHAQHGPRCHDRLAPRAPRISPRRALIVLSPSFSPAFSEDSTIRGSQSTSHACRPGVLPLCSFASVS